MYLCDFGKSIWVELWQVLVDQNAGDDESAVSAAEKKSGEPEFEWVQPRKRLVSLSMSESAANERSGESEWVWLKEKSCESAYKWAQSKKIFLSESVSQHVSWVLQEDGTINDSICGGGDVALLPHHCLLSS